MADFNESEHNQAEDNEDNNEQPDGYNYYGAAFWLTPIILLTLFTINIVKGNWFIAMILLYGCLAGWHLGWELATIKNSTKRAAQRSRRALERHRNRNHSKKH